MFTETFLVSIIKYVSVCETSYIYKTFVEIFEWTFQSVAGKDKLWKCSSKYFDKYFINLTYSVILENVHWNIFSEHLKYDSVC